MKLNEIIIIAIAAISMLSCTPDETVFDDNNEQEENVETYDDIDFEATDWTESTHSKSADPDFVEIFENNAVKRLDIVVTDVRWQSMLDNMTELYGSFGSGGRNSVFSTDENPIFVPAEVYYNGKQWYRVGIRFKGNSSLSSSWQAGILKLSLKLDFDEFEDYYPQIDNQRFYGFKKLSLKNNYDDNSLLREKVAADVFKRAGLAVSNTAFYSLYIDHGNGPEYFGLYTLVEEVDDTLIDTQFASDDGNLYKPEDSGASFVDGSFNEDDFEKKTNEDEADWSDIKDLFSILHSDSRFEDPDAWRSELDAIFDTDVFLHYLAVNTVIQNWDTYGVMTHNYYLYNNPDNNKLTWIPWDNNEALQEGKMGGALTLSFSNIKIGDWPLIEYLYTDNVYREVYNGYVKETIESAFNATELQAIYSNYSALVEPYVMEEMPGYTFLNYSGDFYSATAELKQHVASRAIEAEQYLD